jgi:hypothetical protein
MLLAARGASLACLARMRLLIVLAAAGCTTSDAGGAVTGDIPGGSFQPADTISASVTTDDGAGGTSSDARIHIASTPHLCSDASASPPIDRKQQRFITIELRDVNGATSTTPAVPGSYTIYPNTGTQPPKSASLVVGALDGTCQLNESDSAAAQSGTVTLTSVTGGAYVGSFDVVLDTGGHITGSFDPQPCTQLQAAAATIEHSCI